MDNREFSNNGKAERRLKNRIFPCLPDRLIISFLSVMLKIPTFVLGALLIITGLVGYLFQDPNLSINIVGPLADDAVFTLSDGNQTHTLDRGFASSAAAGEHAFWMVERLNQNHAKDRSQGNYAASERPDNPAYKTQSFWYASSTGDTLSALMKNAETGELSALETVDPEKAKVRFIYNKAVDGTGPVTLTSTNWTNVEGAPGLGEPLTFGKSLTALIPAVIALVLIACVLAAEANPAMRKHVMHVAATVGLVGLVMSAKKVLPAVSEMNWLKNDPNGIIHASSLKPAVMFFSAGLLLIFVVICVLSFVNARKEMAAQPKPKKVEKKKEEDFEDSQKGKNGKDSAKDKGKESDKEDSTDKEKAPKSPAKPMGPAPKSGESKLKTSKSTGSPFGEKKKVAPSGKSKSIDPEKARNPKSTSGQSEGASKPSEKAKAFEQRSGDAKRDEKPEPVKASTPGNSQPRKSDKPSTADSDSEKKPESNEPQDSKPDIASAKDNKKDSAKSEGDEQKESPESSEKKED